jgi:hypothetical protein
VGLFNPEGKQIAVPGMSSPIGLLLHQSQRAINAVQTLTGLITTIEARRMVQQEQCTGQVGDQVCDEVPHGLSLQAAVEILLAENMEVSAAIQELSKLYNQEEMDDDDTPQA